MKNYTTDSRDFSDVIQVYENSDPALGETMSEPLKQLLENTLANRDAISEAAAGAVKITYESDKETLVFTTAESDGGGGGTGGDTEYPLYTGETTVTPKVNEEQVLETEMTRMINDVTVKEIPYSSVSNSAGGATATIG